MYSALEDLSLNHIRTLIFDMGGTLYGPSINHAKLKQYYYDKTGVIQSDVTLDQIEAALVEPDIWLTDYMKENRVASTWEPDFEIWVEYERRVLEELQLEADPVSLTKTQLTTLLDALKYFGNRVVDDCREILVELRYRGYNIGLASNRFGDPIPHLERSAIVQYFDAIEYTNVPGYKKPSPYMLIRVAEKLNVNPITCAYIGNHFEVDFNASKRAGMHPILVTQYGIGNSAEIHENVTIIETLSELLTIFT